MVPRIALRPPTRSMTSLLLALVVAVALPGLAAAQPFGIYTIFSGTGSSTSGNGFLQVPDNAALSPTGAITLEAWVSMTTPAATCRSLIGKDYTQSYWLGVCGSTVRAYFQGDLSHDAGVVPNGQWTHIAVTYDGTTQKHYINGELIQSFAVSAPPGVSSAPLEIGGDASWPYSPNGAMTEVRLWNVARTVDEIRSTINIQLKTPQAGLVAVWSMAGANDALGHHNGTFHGVVSALAPAAESTCGFSTSSALCLNSAFSVNISWRDGTTTGVGTTVPVNNTGSGLFWFFSPDEWEVMVKVIDGCDLNESVWLFSAATTNVFYRMNVTDVRSGVTKVYFNYPGPPAPAVTDTEAFPGSCPP